MKTLIAVLALGSALQEQAPTPIKPDRTWVLVETKWEGKECRRLETGADWAAFWKEHTGGAEKAPPVDFEKQIVVVMPFTLTLVAGLKRGEVEVVDHGTWVHLTANYTVLPVGAQSPNDGKLLRTATIAILPRHAKHMSFGVASDGVGRTLQALSIGGPGGTELKGKLERVQVEGGAWVIRVGKKSYDLHGHLGGIAVGSEVVIDGSPAPPGTACIHMCGEIFQLRSVRLADAGK
jgi:hypothetical protein